MFFRVREQIYNEGKVEDKKGRCDITSYFIPLKYIKHEHVGTEIDNDIMFFALFFSYYATFLYTQWCS